MNFHIKFYLTYLKLKYDIINFYLKIVLYNTIFFNTVSIFFNFFKL